MDSIRKQRIESAIVRLISEMIVSGKVKDPRVGFVTVHRAKISPDLNYLSVWVTSYCTPAEKRKLLKGLHSASSFIQSVISEQLRLRVTPKLHFLWDDDYIKALEVNELIDKSAPKEEES
ncbi:MAG: 30S ribosome-binding factor RbfA [Spirochaetota bacterium]